MLNKILPNTIFICFLVLSTHSSVANTFNIKELGADTNGKNSCTEIINSAIIKAAKEGGGTIYFPAGKYLTAAIKMSDNITLHLESGAELFFSDNFEEYLPFVKIRYEGVFMKSFCPLIYANNCNNITIEGAGTLNGNGQQWWDSFNLYRAEKKQFGEVQNPNKLHSLWRGENKNFLTEENYQLNYGQAFYRPPFIQFIECNNINISGITVKNSPFWTINPVGCNDVMIHNIRVFNPEEGPNTDGINPSSCKNVRISDCYISVGDDCITIKSGKNKDGREYGKPCENITINNCIMLAGHGGVVIGSEMSGGVKNVTISNCVFNGTDNGIRLKSSRGRGGTVEAIRVSNIVMQNIKKQAFIFNLYYDKKSTQEAVSERTPIFTNIHLSNISGKEVESFGYISGIEEMPVSNLSFSDINLQSRKGFSINMAENIDFHNVEISSSEGPSLEIKNSNTVIIDNIKSSFKQDNNTICEITDSENVIFYNCFSLTPLKEFIKSTKSKVYFAGNTSITEM